jgi:hypothetical protein
MTNYQIAPQRPVFANMLSRQEAYKEVFTTDKGKQVLADLMEFCAINRTALSGNEHQTHVNLGKQMIGYHLQNVLNSKIVEKKEDD